RPRERARAGTSAHGCPGSGPVLGRGQQRRLLRATPPRGAGLGSRPGRGDAVQALASGAPVGGCIQWTDQPLSTLVQLRPEFVLPQYESRGPEVMGSGSSCPSTSRLWVEPDYTTTST